MDHHDFTDDQWRILQRAPFLVLSGISGRYRDFPLEERLVFERWLLEASKSPGELGRHVLTSVVEQLDELWTAYEDYPGTIVSGLCEVASVLKTRPLAEVELFRDALVQVLGLGIAKARGPYGRQPTTEGEQMLTMLDEFLRPGLTITRTSGDAA